VGGGWTGTGCDMADLGVDTARTNRAKGRQVVLSGIGRSISLFAGFVAARVA
jgi:type IV secretory pathway TrbD component